MQIEKSAAEPAIFQPVNLQPVMSTHQKAHIVTRSSGLNDLNDFLREGWRVAYVSPMGGGADTVAALVVLEQRGEEDSAEMVEQAEEEMEEVLSEVTEGRAQEPELTEERNGGPPGS
jgi:hypothetical protein